MVNNVAYKEISFEILGRMYIFSTDESEEWVREILNKVKEKAENIRKQARRPIDSDYIFLLLLLNCMMDKKKLQNELERLTKKYSIFSKES